MSPVTFAGALYDRTNDSKHWKRSRSSGRNTNEFKHLNFADSTNNFEIAAKKNFFDTVLGRFSNFCLRHGTHSHHNRGCLTLVNHKVGIYMESVWKLILAHGDGTIINRPTPSHISLGNFQIQQLAKQNKKRANNVIFIKAFIWKLSGRSNRTSFQNAIGFCMCRYIDFQSLCLIGLIFFIPIVIFISIRQTIHRVRRPRQLS